MAYNNTQALAIPTAAQTALDEATIDPRLIMAAKAIQLMAGQDDKGNPKISADMALAAAMYQAGTGQLLGRDFYVNEKIGRMEGYRGVSRDAMDRGVGEVQIKYRSLTTQEAEDHEIAAGDTAVVCEVYQLRAWNLAQRMGQAYEPISGVGVVRKVEKFNAHDWKESSSGKKYKALLPENQWKPLTLEGGMTWRKKAQNRAYKEALRHVPGAHASTAEVLEEATLGGMTEQPPEAARLSMEQAIAWAKQHEVAGGPSRDAIEEGEFTEVTQDAANDDAFEQLRSASAERAAGNGKPAPTNVRPEWHDKEAAVEWGFDQGCFDHANHAENAFNKIVTAVKAEHAPKIPTYAQVFDSWHADVLRRVEDHNAKISAALDAQAAGDELPVFESR